jgi:hypothetical protein
MQIQNEYNADIFTITKSITTTLNKLKNKNEMSVIFIDMR